MKTSFSILLSFLLVTAPPAGTAPPGSRVINSAGGTVNLAPGASRRQPALEELLRRSYLELFEIAAEFKYTEDEFERVADLLEDTEERCVDHFENHVEGYENELDAAQEELRERTAEITEEERHAAHCRIQNLRAMKEQADSLARNGIPLAYDNREAKLRLIREWPERHAEIQQTIARGEHHDRQFGDIDDIGFRNVGEGQEEDIEIGVETIEQMERNNLLSPEIRNAVVVDYVESLARDIASHSDLRIPIKVFVLNGKEINGFALPGGFLFLQRGLLEATENEAQLAGVIAHEIAHTAARHGHQLMERQTITSIIYQVAQVAAIVLTGGVAGIGLQYAFTGLGLILNLDLLGVSRDFELEADRLGIQYAWNAGYDPDGFLRFFDKMATTEGYVDGASWFRTHPPFFERMVRAQQEILYLPDEGRRFQSSSDAFEEMKRELEDVVTRAEEEENRPSLRAPEEGCAPPEEAEYRPGEPIEALCSEGRLE